MSDETPAAPAPVAPPATPPAAPGKLRRRDMVVGLGGLVALGGAAAIGRYTTPRRLPEGAEVTYSQCGEDRILGMMATYFSITNGSFMDIGSAQPIVNSNTYLLYTWGWRGLLVEPNPALASRIRSDRPGDTLLTAAIGLTDATESDYYMFNNFELNTLDPEQRDMLLRKEPHLVLEKTVKVPMVNINRAIAEHLGGRAPDVLSIDIEGLDLAVLRTLDFAKYRPKIVVAETLITLSHNHNPETTPFMVAHGYEVRGMTYPNTIYVDRALITR